MYKRQHLSEPAEVALADAVDGLPDHAGDSIPEWAADAGALVEPLGRFFDDVLVMADDADVRAARLGLLQTVVERAPRGIAWQALHTAIA